MNQSGLRYLVLFAIFIAFVATSFAQFPNQPSISPKLSIYGGYSGYNPGGKSSGIEVGLMPHGWNSGAEVKFTPRYSFFADYGSYKNSNTGTTQTYLFGPRFTFHAKALAPFAEVMMGFQRIAAKNQPTYTAFSEAFGGGLDVAIAHSFSLRLFQADLVYAADHEKTQLNLNQFYGARVSAGIVWNLSKRHRPSVVAKENPTPTAKPEVAIKSEEKPAAEVARMQEKKSEVVEEKKSEVPVAETKTAESPAAVPTTAEEKKPEAAVPPSKSSVTSAVEKPAPAPPAVTVEEKKTTSVANDAEVKSVGTLIFPYEQYPTYLSPQDKRSLDAVASRMKLEPESTVSIVGASPRWAGPKAAAQRAVNSKDYLIKKGIAADRVKVFARPATKSKPAKTELMFVPAGQTFTAGSATPVDEQHVKPEHLHVAHPEWREK